MTTKRNPNCQINGFDFNSFMYPDRLPELQRSQDHMFKTWKDRSVKQCSRAGQKELTSPLYTSHGRPLITEKLTHSQTVSHFMIATISSRTKYLVSLNRL